MNNSKINISKRLNECLSTQIFDLLIKCGEFTERNSASLFLVGGCLRDILLNKRPKDIDLTLVNGNSNLVQNLSEYLLHLFGAYLSLICQYSLGTILRLRAALS